MNRTMKKITVLAVAVTLSTGALFAQPHLNQPRENDFHAPQPQQNFEAGKLLGIVDEVTNKNFTFIDMDGKKVTVEVTPFTELQDIIRLERVDTKAKDVKDQLKRTYIAIAQLEKGDWVDVKAYKTAGGKNVAEYVRVIRMPRNGGDK